MKFEQNKVSRRGFLRKILLTAAGSLLFGHNLINMPKSLAEEGARIHTLRGNENFMRNKIFITIDDCIYPSIVRDMFNLLRQYGISGTFFPNTTYLTIGNTEIVDLWREIHRSGFDIGYHTTNHFSSWQSREDLERDFSTFTDHMRELLNDPTFTPRFARPPYGNWDNIWMDWIIFRNLINVSWNYVPDTVEDTSAIVEATMNHPGGGGIILLHARQTDLLWLRNNILPLTRIARRNQGTITNLSRAIALLEQ